MPARPSGHVPTCPVEAAAGIPNRVKSDPPIPTDFSRLGIF
jgi:hypothetical protein